MIKLFVALKFIHVLGAAVLFGGGLGIVFFVALAHSGGDVGAISATIRSAFIADRVLIAVALALQPITGIALARGVGYALTTPWVATGLFLYVVVAICWLAVLAVQSQLQALAQVAAATMTALPPRYAGIYRVWCALSVLMLAGLMLIIAVMIWKPMLW